jgi:very-short-patch-repair endonuclease
LEDAFIALATDLPEPLVNTVHEGEELDFCWPDCRLNVEVDGPGHRRPAVKRADARRDGKLKAAGYTVVRLTDVELKRAPNAALEKVLRNWPTSTVGRGSCE